MILRVIRGRADSDQFARVAEALQATLAPGRGSHPNLARLHVGWRERAAEPQTAAGECDVVVLSFWTSAEAAAAADAKGASPLSIARRQIRSITVDHFEIDETVLRDPDAHARWIRIATGGFSKAGADKEMLDLLRQRAPALGDPLLEACVGRRIVGREVQIAFVSIWREQPAGQSLADAFWSDIALRYDFFEVDVFETIAAADAR